LVAFREPPMDRLVGLELASVIVCLILLLVAEGLHRPSFFDLALALAMLSFAGGLVFARFLERWV
jgi:multicomponent Na+:H+ antiporter subunit F